MMRYMCLRVVSLVEKGECECDTCVYVLYLFLAEGECEYDTCVYVLYQFIEEEECK